MTARTAWYIEGNSKTTHTLHRLNGKLRAQAQRAGGVRDQSRMAATRHEARGTARESDGIMCRDARLPWMFCPK